MEKIGQINRPGVLFLNIFLPILLRMNYEITSAECDPEIETPRVGNMDKGASFMNLLHACVSRHQEYFIIRG